MLAPVPRSALFADDAFYIWGASMVRDPEGTCHLFYSRWPRSTGFEAWVSHSEIAHVGIAQFLVGTEGEHFSFITPL